MDLLFEIGTEELPPATVVPALEFLATELARRAGAERLTHGALETFGTPRRLAVLALNVAPRTPDIEETKLGPAVKVAFDAAGQPTKAAEGFARGQGVPVGDLQRIATDKGEYVAVRAVKPGLAAADVLVPLLEGLTGAIPWPKSMKWGWGAESWARPVHWMVALLGDQVLPVKFAGIEAGRETRGHRFLSPGAVALARPTEYAAALEAAQVVPRIDERKRRIFDVAHEIAGPSRLVEDEDLLDEVTQLVEKPFAIGGSFAAKYLVLPREVLISEMREHQRYFAVEDEDGKLVNRFVVVLNTPVKDPAMVVRGFERVLVARLSDAEFFLRRDRSRPLESRVADLGRVVFLHGLGSMAQKTERVEKLAGYLASVLHPGQPEVREHAVRAAHLSKADLTTAMVTEFPELQGVMGREYSHHDCEAPEVAVAVFEHYQPRGASDSVPQTAAGTVAALADKIDTLAGAFSMGLEPSGAADPYGLRRAALGIIRTALERGLVFSLRAAIGEAQAVLAAQVEQDGAQLKTAGGLVDRLVGFFDRRLKAFLGDQFRPDVIDAVLATGLDDIGAAVARIRALSAMRERAGFEPLAIAFKRVANILREAPNGPAVDEQLFQEEAERGLWQAYDAVRHEVAGEIARRDYDGAASTLIRLKEPVDRFFEAVLVMAPDERLRANRLALLRDLRALFEQMADISRIQVAG